MGNKPTRWETHGTVIKLDTWGDERRIVKFGDMQLIRLGWWWWPPWPFARYNYRYRCEHKPTGLFTIAYTQRDAIDQLILDVINSMAGRRPHAR